MSFKAIFNRGFEDEILECISSANNLYEFESKEGTRIKIRKLSDESLAFQRIAKGLDVKGILKLNSLTKMSASVSELNAKVEYNVFMTRMFFDFPNEVSFAYQIVHDGKEVDEPTEIIITEKE